MAGSARFEVKGLCKGLLCCGIKFMPETNSLNTGTSQRPTSLLHMPCKCKNSKQILNLLMATPMHVDKNTPAAEGKLSCRVKECLQAGTEKGE